MTEKVWCKREKKIVSTLEIIGKWIAIIAAIVAVAFCFGANIGYIVGLIPVSAPLSMNAPIPAAYTLLFATAMCTVFAIGISGVMSIVLADSSTEKENLLSYSKGLFTMAVVLLALGSVNEIVRFEPAFGYVGIAIIVIFGSLMYIHIKCEEEKFLAGEKK